MSQNKTVPTDSPVSDYLQAIGDPRRREEARRLCELMQQETGEPPIRWGTGLIGFGRYRYRYESGREGEWMLTGFAARKTQLVVYLMDGFSERAELLAQLGPHKVGKSCLYIKRLDAVDESVLVALIRASVGSMRARYETD